MAKIKKYIQGGVITSLDELMKQRFIYLNGKITHFGWFQNWQIRDCERYINRRMLNKVIDLEYIAKDLIKRMECHFPLDYFTVDNYELVLKQMEELKYENTLPF